MDPSSDPGAQWHEAMCAHDFSRAHAIADAVLRVRDPCEADDPRLPYHLRWVWDGTPPDGRAVLVRCYHGLGDTVQFSRYLPALADRAASVRVEAQAALVPLLAAQFPHVGWHVFDPARPRPAGDVCVEIMELAHLLRADAGVAPYVSATPMAGLANATALCWRSGGWDAARDVPWAMLRARLAGPLVCVQRDRRADEAGPFAREIGDGDVDALASLLAGCARVVAVDTFVAHLAGALGRPTTLLLRAQADWRWGAGGRTPWYPSMTLLRQAQDGDWSAPLDAMAPR